MRAAAEPLPQPVAPYDNDRIPLMSQLHLIAHDLERTGKGFFIDVGANNGMWLKEMMEALAKKRPELVEHVTPVWVEPSRKYHASLDAMARRWKGIVVKDAAWTREGHVHYYESRNSIASSLVNATAHRYGFSTTYTVRTFDLARYVHTLRGATLLMKHDIEASEYATIPHLVASGVICHISFLAVEWHLASLPADQRLVALGFEHGLPAVLSGCSRTVYYYGQSDLNMNKARVPGLAELGKLSSGLKDDA